MSTQLTAAINSLNIEDLDSFQSFMELLKSKKKSLQSEKAKAVRAEAAAIKHAEKEERKAEADRKKKEQALLDSKLSKIESEVRSVFKVLLKEFSEKHVEGGEQKTERKWNKLAYSRFCKYLTPEKVQKNMDDGKNSGGKKKWNSEQWKLLSKDIQISPDSEWNRMPEFSEF